jgi:diamine N-acetyltransferase
MENSFITDILKGKKITLRAPEPADIDFIYRMENDPQIWHFGSTLMPYSRYQIEQYILNTQHDIYTEKQIRLIIETTANNSERKRVGAIDLFEFDPVHRRAGVGILIIREERENGYAAEALELLVLYSFKILQLHQLFCNITVDNQACINLFEKAGFVTCGLKKEWQFHQNRWVDELSYQLINK